jgi:hypothetical protein
VGFYILRANKETAVASLARIIARAIRLFIASVTADSFTINLFAP